MNYFVKCTGRTTQTLQNHILPLELLGLRFVCIILIQIQRYRYNDTLTAILLHVTTEPVEHLRDLSGGRQLLAADLQLDVALVLTLPEAGLVPGLKIIAIVRPIVLIIGLISPIVLITLIRSYSPLSPRALISPITPIVQIGPNSPLVLKLLIVL